MEDLYLPFAEISVKSINDVISTIFVNPILNSKRKALYMRDFPTIDCDRIVNAMVKAMDGLDYANTLLYVIEWSNKNRSHASDIEKMELASLGIRHRFTKEEKFAIKNALSTTFAYKVQAERRGNAHNWDSIIATIETMLGEKK